MMANSPARKEYAANLLPRVLRMVEDQRISAPKVWDYLINLEIPGEGDDRDFYYSIKWYSSPAHAQNGLSKWLNNQLTPEWWIMAGWERALADLCGDSEPVLNLKLRLGKKRQVQESEISVEPPSADVEELIVEAVIQKDWCQVITLAYQELEKVVTNWKTWV